MFRTRKNYSELSNTYHETSPSRNIISDDQDVLPRISIGADPFAAENETETNDEASETKKTKDAKNSQLFHSSWNLWLEASSFFMFFCRVVE